MTVEKFAFELDHIGIAVESLAKGFEFYDGEKQSYVELRLMGGDVFEENEFNAVASDLLDSAEADVLAVA